MGNRKEESRALTNLAIIYTDFGQKEQARAYCEKALAIYSDLEDLWGGGWAQNILGGIYADLGQSARARDHLMRALQIRRQLGNRLGEGRTLNNLGRIYTMLGQSERAPKCCEEALISGTPSRMLCKGAKEKNWNPALKGTERLLAIYDYTTFGMVS